MAVAKWNTPSSQGANIAGVTLDGLANGATSAFVTHDNSSNLDLYADVEVVLGSITSTTGANILLRVYAQSAGAVTPDDTGSVGGGEVYPMPLTVGAGAKTVVFPMVRLYPRSLRLQITNLAGVALAASGNTIKVGAFNEQVV